jgi:DNA repair protein RadC
MQTNFKFIHADTPRAGVEAIGNATARIMPRIVRQVKIATICEEPATVEKCDAPEIAAQFWREHIEHAPWFDNMREHLVVLLLNTRYRVNSYALVSIGSLNESVAHPRDILRPAIVAGAYAFILMHNHPSGDASPSQSDHSLTRRISEAAELLQIKILDHVVIGHPHAGAASSAAYFSFKKAGVL